MAHQLDVREPAPRVNFELMAHYIGKRVKLVGKVEGIDNNILKVKAADDGVVDVLLTTQAPLDAYVEIEGVVESPNTVREESSTGFGNNFDMTNYNQLCRLSHADYKGLFL